MAAEAIRAQILERPAPTAGPGQWRVVSLPKGRSAIIAAVVLSALLHGALAATILLWPDAPKPLPVGGPITVTLVATAPTVGGPAQGTPAPAATGTAGAVGHAEVARKSSARRTADTATPAAGRDKPPQPEPRRGKAATIPLAIEPASGKAGPPPVETTAPPAAVQPAKATVIPSFPPPPRRPVRRPRSPAPRPVAIARVEPPPVPPARPEPAAETAAARPPGLDGPARANDGGTDTVKPTPMPQSAAGIADADAATDGGTGSAGPASAADAGAPVIGPRFTMGTAANPRPRYPFFARRQGIEGRVVLRVFVRPDGRVGTIDIVHSSTHTILDDAAIDALRRWRFEPATRAGVPVASWIDIPVTFRLRG